MQERAAEDTPHALYLSKLPGMVAGLSEAITRFGKTASADACATAITQAHKLAGSGGTFGFPDISLAARGLETVLALCQGAAGAPTPENQALLKEGLQALRAALAQAQQAQADGLYDTTAPIPLMAESAGLNRRIDIIEPDTRAARLAQQLGQAGYQTRVFETPEAMAAQAASDPAAGPAAAILARLPDGEAAQQALRALARPDSAGRSTVPLVFMEGETGFAARLAAVRAGGVAYFPQPLDVQSLLGYLDRLVAEQAPQPYRVLIVDDDEILAGFYASVLQAAGMVTAVATDPTRVMGLLTGFQPDLITCDIYMPGCNGMELAAVIRQQEAFVRVPLVFLSSETRLDRQSQALQQGGDDFIIKPVVPAQLVAAVQSRARRYRSLLAAEDTLRISEERSRLVLESSLDGFIQTLEDGSIVSANQAACDMFEMTEQAMRQAGLPGLFDAGARRLNALLQQQGRSGKYRGEITCVRHNGLAFPAEISASRHASSNGETQGSIILRDITERKVAEDNIMRLNAELEARVERRTAALGAANQELQAFSHSLAHDLRQPYIAINGLTSLLEREMAPHLSERGQHYLQRIRAGVSQLNDRTDALLSLAQLSQATTLREPVDLAALCHGILAALARKEPARKVEVRVQSPLPAMGNPDLLKLLLRNLLGNAWKFTARQPLAVIEVRGERDAGGQMVYCVADNGAGFEMAYADKLFDAFQQLHSPSEFSGAGVGLALASRIVARQGGRIWAESALGQGARFYFTVGTDATP